MAPSTAARKDYHRSTTHRKERKRSGSVTEQTSLERLIAQDSQEELEVINVQKKPRASVVHRGSTGTIPTNYTYNSTVNTKEGVPAPVLRSKRVRDEGVQVVMVDHERKIKQQQIRLKKITADNVKLETQVRGYEQRFRDIRNDVVYHDLKGDGETAGGFCAPVKEAWQSFKQLFHAAWFQCWFKIQVRLEEKHRQLSKTEATQTKPGRDSTDMSQRE